MIFALLDLVQYRMKIGAYGADQKDAAMGYMSHYGEVPQSVIDELRLGDTIYTQRLNSIFSWGTMYFTSSSVDHVAIYVENGQLLHMTLSGSKKASLNVVARGARILAVRPTVNAIREGFGERSDGEHIDRSRAFWHGLPPKVQLPFYLLRILTAYYPDRYKWQFLADIFLAALLVDVPLWLISHIFVALPIATAIALRTFYNLFKYGFARMANKPFRVMSHPDIGYRAFFKGGGILFAGFDTYVLGPWGILPIKLFAAFMAGSSPSGEGADDGTSNDLQEIGKRVRDAVKNGNFILLPPESKDDEKDQYQNKKINE